MKLCPEWPVGFECRSGSEQEWLDTIPSTGPLQEPSSAVSLAFWLVPIHSFAEKMAHRQRLEPSAMQLRVVLWG